VTGGAADLDEILAGASGSPGQWSAVADGWGRQRDFIWELSHEVGTTLVEALEPRAGETFLELACGPGDTGLLIAARVGETGRLISTDVAPEMVALARARADELGLTNVEHLVVDAQEIPLADGSVDGIVCRWGYMLMPDPQRALAESARVLRPGGRLALSVWATAAENPWGTATTRALVELGLIERPDPDRPGPFRLGDRERLLSVIEGAGLVVVSTRDVPVVWRHPTFEAFWERTADLSALLRTTLSVLSDPEIAEVRQVTEKLLNEFGGSTGELAIPGLCRNVLCRPGARSG
jgi:SAM-dependent methyltransferase